MSEAMQMPGIGELVAGKYRIESIIGKGGMGTIYAARHEITNRLFALKILHPSQTRNVESRERFIREAKLAGAIEHSGVVEIYDVGHHGTALFMVMDLLKGETLGERLRRGPLAMEEAVRIMIAVLSAVGAAHKRGILHRDLKPDNIFLCRSSDTDQVFPKILDFGVSKAISPERADSKNLTATGIILGTPMYMSPEQVRGAKDIDLRTDIYALGAILYEMLTGTVPFRANTLDALIFKILSAKPDPLTKRMKAVSKELNDVVMRAMAADKEQRYPDIESFAKDLIPFLAEEREFLNRDRAAVTQMGNAMGGAIRDPSGVAAPTMPEIVGMSPAPRLTNREAISDTEPAPPMNYPGFSPVLRDGQPSPQNEGSRPPIEISLPVRRFPFTLVLGVGGVILGTIIILWLTQGGDEPKARPNERSTATSEVSGVQRGPDNNVQGRNQVEEGAESQEKRATTQHVEDEIPQGIDPLDLMELQDPVREGAAQRRRASKPRSSSKKGNASGGNSQRRRKPEEVIFEVENNDILNPF